MPLQELPAFLQKLGAYSGERQTKLALKLVTLTFLRTTELRAGKWNELEELDGKSAQWRIPAERMKMRLDALGTTVAPSCRSAARTPHTLGH
jgi:hypothetical protein